MDETRVPRKTDLVLYRTRGMIHGETEHAAIITFVESATEVLLFVFPKLSSGFPIRAWKADPVGTGAGWYWPEKEA